jgi:hypothetical protein
MLKSMKPPLLAASTVFATAAITCATHASAP